MKVGVFLGDYSPDDGGGYTFQSETIQALIRLDNETEHRFVLISAAPQTLKPMIAGTHLDIMPYSSSGFIEQIKTRIGRGFTGLRKRGWMQTAFDQALKSEGIEFLWFTNPRPVDVDIPYMTIVWDMQHRLQPWFPEVGEKENWFSREGANWRFMPRASYIIAGTEAGKKEISLFYGIPDWRIKLLPHPTPSFALTSAQQPRTILDRFNLPDPFLFYPAQFWAHKNHANLLYALAHLRDEYGLIFHLALSGSDHGNRKYIETLASTLGLSGQVHFVGFVSIEEMTALYQYAFALTYVTMFGPENLPPLEAMALGCPVVATNVSGAEEQFGEAAILVAATQPESIASGIKRLHDDPDLRNTLIAHGKKRAAAFTIEDFVRGVYKILDEFEPYRRTWRN